MASSDDSTIFSDTENSDSTTTEDSDDDEPIVVMEVGNIPANEAEEVEIPASVETVSANVQIDAVAVQPSTSSQNAEEAAATDQDEGSSKSKEIAETSEPPAQGGGIKRSQDNCDSDEDQDDGRLCPICMDVWSNSGSHRLACLRCGHLFGYSCIVRWLQVGCAAGQKRCPQCNKRAFPKDIRLLYARKLQVIDTTERDRLKEELEAVKMEKNRLELELARSQLNFKLHQQRLDDLKVKLNELQNAQRNSFNQFRANSAAWRITLNRSMEICKNGGCRVLTYNAWMNLLCVSQSSTNNLFSGYGIKKIDAVEFRPTQFVFLHPKPIRDLAHNPLRNDILLSVSLDKSAKLLNVSSNAVVHSYNTDSPLWSCCWDVDNANAFYVGSQNGVVTQYDIRQPSTSVSRLFVQGDMSPVTSIVSLPARPGRVLPRGGLLVCRLNSCWAYQRVNTTDFEGQQLPLDGPFTSLCYEQQTDHVLVSTRPNTRSPHASHILCQLGPGDSEVILNPVHTFLGGTSQKLLSRPCQLTVPGDTLVAAHQESNGCVAIWSVSSGNLMLRLPAADPIIDLCPVQVNNTLHLASLSQKMLRIYQVT